MMQAKKKKTDGRNRWVPPKARMVWKTKWYGERKITARIKQKKERKRKRKRRKKNGVDGNRCYIQIRAE